MLHITRPLAPIDIRRLANSPSGPIISSSSEKRVQVSWSVETTRAVGHAGGVLARSLGEPGEIGDACYTRSDGVERVVLRLIPSSTNTKTPHGHDTIFGPQGSGLDLLVTTSGGASIS